jgi:glycosyltransferase involved in cell wall biosynthesis
VILDLDDVESVLVGQRLRNLWARQLRVSRSGRLASLPAPLQRLVVRIRRTPRLVSRTAALVLDWPGWRRGEWLAFRGCERVLVCSEADRKLLGATQKIVVVPNGFDLHGAPAGEMRTGSGATIGFWGLMSYPPNTDGATWLVTEILPHLRRLVPEVQVRIIGRGGDNLRVPSPPDVVATGEVADMSPELARVDVAVVPLRMGGGTRIKIVEAWAHRIPVVSTSLGAYGLDARDGHDVLLADDPAEFARAVHRVLSDGELRRRLVRNGSARAAQLSWRQISAQLSPLIATLAAAGSPANGAHDASTLGTVDPRDSAGPAG